MPHTSTRRFAKHPLDDSEVVPGFGSVTARRRWRRLARGFRALEPRRRNTPSMSLGSHPTRADAARFPALFPPCPRLAVESRHDGLAVASHSHRAPPCALRRPHSLGQSSRHRIARAGAEALGVAPRRDDGREALASLSAARSGQGARRARVRLRQPRSDAGRSRTRATDVRGTWGADSIRAPTRAARASLRAPRPEHSTRTSPATSDRIVEACSSGRLTRSGHRATLEVGQVSLNRKTGPDQVSETIRSTSDAKR